MKRSFKSQLSQLHNGDMPLLTDDEILQTLRSAPTSVPEVPTPRKSRFGLAAGSAALVTATILAVAFLPDMLTDETNVAVAEPEAKILPAPASSDVRSDIQAMDIAEAERSANGPSARMANAESPTTPDFEFIEESDEVVGKLNLKVTSSTVTYTEDGLTITVTTKGISVQGAAESLSTKTPRHISLYRDGDVYATWFDGDRPETDVDELVPMKLGLKDQRNTIFPYADVVLWYEKEPVEDFVTSTPSREPVSALFSGVSVYPNPVRGASATAKLQTSGTCTTSAELVDINGRQVMQLWQGVLHTEGMSQVPLVGLDQLANGMYLMVVTEAGSNNRVTQRILIER